MKLRLSVVVVSLALSIACGGSSPTSPSPTPTPSPTPSPTPAPTPTPSTVSLTGNVTVTGTSVRLGGATVRILDGANAGRSTTTDTNGQYRFDGLQPDNGNVSATASGWEEARAGTFINGTNTLNFTIRTLSPFSRIGTGNNVFDKPSYVSRVSITGRFTGSSQNFVVWCGTSLLVNEILGTFAGHSTTYSGVHSTPSCTEVRVEISNGVSWTLTELR